MIEKIKNNSLGKSPFSKGVAKPGDLSVPHVEIKSLIFTNGENRIGKSPFYSPFDKGDEENASN